MKQLIEENQEKDIAEILKILSWQQVITSQGATYTGEKDWALNKILNWHKQSLKQFIDGLIEREEKSDMETGFNAQYNDQFFEAKGFHRAKLETILHLKKLKEQME